MLPQYAKNAGLEAGGRHIAMLLGVLEDGCKSTFYGYGQSSGSSNVVMAFEPAGQKLARTLSMKRYRALSCFHNTIRIVEGT